jgi:GNAT superfamily N-acetyltransferase
MSGAEIEIRRAFPEDASRIAAVLLDSFMEFKSLYSDGGFAATTPGAEKVRARIEEGPVWLALRRGAVSGTIAAVVKTDSACIRGMAVLPSARGSGVGFALLQRAEDWARRQRCLRLLLSTTPFLSSAIGLYERFGFRRVEQGPHELFGTPLFTMEKRFVSSK